MWVAEFAQIPACLVSLVHLSRRVGRTRDNPDLWSLLRQKAVDCLQSLSGNGITDDNRLILDRIMNGCTFEELETTLPYFPDKDDQEYLSDRTMRGYYHRSTEFPLDCWEPYGGMTMSNDARRVAMTTVLSEYYKQHRGHGHQQSHG